MEKGLVFDIRHFSVHDGPGIRTTVFFKGCPLICTWCHNPESQKDEPEQYQRKVKLDGEEFAFTETIGRYMTADEVFDEVKSHISIFDESAGEVTFSGGEPLMQLNFLLELLRLCRANEIHTAYVYEDRSLTFKELLFALLVNLEGYEDLRYRLVYETPKWGNNDDYADRHAVMVFNSFYKAVNGRQTYRGGVFRINMPPTTSHVYFGSKIGAMPDGRKAFEPFSGGISSVQGADRLL